MSFNHTNAGPDSECKKLSSSTSTFAGTVQTSMPYSVKTQQKAPASNASNKGYHLDISVALPSSTAPIATMAIHGISNDALESKKNCRSYDHRPFAMPAGCNT